MDPTHQPPISLLNPKQIPTGLTAGLGFLHADVYRAEVSVIHAQESDELAGRVEDGDVVRDAVCDAISHGTHKGRLKRQSSGSGRDLL